MFNGVRILLGTAFLFLMIALFGIGGLGMSHMNLQRQVDDLADLRDPETHLYGKLRSIENRLMQVEKRSSKGVTFGLAIASACVSQKASGPAEVPFNHPVVDVMGTNQEPMWLEIVVRQNGVNRGRYLFAAVTSGGFSATLDGWVSAIRGTAGRHVFSSKYDYSLRVWIHPYTESDPLFRPDQLALETDFQVPTCGDKN